MLYRLASFCNEMLMFQLLTKEEFYCITRAIIIIYGG
nr:MAG TPA: hypothetical protein [Caudoviricetes sp.]